MENPIVKIDQIIDETLAVMDANLFCDFEFKTTRYDGEKR